MFWYESIRHGHRYCVCCRKWKSFKIVYIKYLGSIVEIWVTPENGERVLLLFITNGEALPAYLNWDVKFLEWQHVKIEVMGGDIGIVGEITNTPRKYENKINKFPVDCPFLLGEDWEQIAKNKSEQEIESLSHTTSVYRRIEEIKPNKNFELQDRLTKAFEYLGSVKNFYEYDGEYLLKPQIIGLIDKLNTIQITYNKNVNNSTVEDDVLRLLILVEDYKDVYQNYLQKQRL